MSPGLRPSDYSLARWGQEYAVVRNWREVERAIGMLEYAGRYYVPAPGYRSDPSTEAALAEQRERTVRAIATVLREYTGQDFGVDATRWQVWAVNQVRPQGGQNVPPGQDRGPDLPPD